MLGFCFSSRSIRLVVDYCTDFLKTDKPLFPLSILHQPFYYQTRMLFCRMSENIYEFSPEVDVKRLTAAFASTDADLKEQLRPGSGFKTEFSWILNNSAATMFLHRKRVVQTESFLTETPALSYFTSDPQTQSFTPLETERCDLTPIKRHRKPRVVQPVSQFTRCRSPNKVFRKEKWIQCWSFEVFKRKQRQTWVWKRRRHVAV